MNKSAAQELLETLIPKTKSKIRDPSPKRVSERRVPGIHQPNLLYFTYLSSALVCVSVIVQNPSKSHRGGWCERIKEM